MEITDAEAGRFVREMVACAGRKCRECEHWDERRLVCANDDEHERCCDAVVVVTIWREYNQPPDRPAASE